MMSKDKNSNCVCGVVLVIGWMIIISVDDDDGDNSRTNGRICRHHYDTYTQSKREGEKRYEDQCK